ncbi:NAD-dependent epimerase/dehydratase family protein [Paraburkholderia sp. 1N]|uniref:NAD-dependent epimerase/dehydratase family protein n=1 Tax=Paraburkholderia solitsugae TaxID=2675748 RepID=A0ABX2BPL8_9BURK|nr:NAD-dependent epimerase/dehydratase family protein [Paraburkholderia solitsugae]NPT42842.1 NAD-dependent epimerase/dehydratase family protein [Paraburkholderia solitsugae]
MRVLLTGAAGFLGRALTRALLAAEHLTFPGRGDSAITELILVDRVSTPAPVPPDSPIPVRVLTGDLADAGFVDHLASLDSDSIFHLAASLTLDAERDMESGYLINVESLRRLVESSTKPAKFVFASSIAGFGGELPASVDDSLRSEPDTTYGVHKAIAELMVADYSRKGRIDGRALRLPIVLIRDGAPTPAVSDRIAAIVREPLRGRDVVSPLALGTRLPVASSQAVAAALIALHNLPADVLPHGRVMNLPALTVSVADMVAAVERRRSGAAVGRIRFDVDSELQRIVDSWPKEFTSANAVRLGLCADANFESIVESYLARSA